MGLFRNRARKNREKAAASLPQEQARVTAQAQGGRRAMTTEERPNPDQPGWGRAIGQQIGKARDDRTPAGS
jgi:hypothetical protein